MQWRVNPTSLSCAWSCVLYLTACHLGVHGCRGGRSVSVRPRRQPVARRRRRRRVLQVRAGGGRRRRLDVGVGLAVGVVLPLAAAAGDVTQESPAVKRRGRKGKGRLSCGVRDRQIELDVRTCFVHSLKCSPDLIVSTATATSSLPLGACCAVATSRPPPPPLPRAAGSDDIGTGLFAGYEAERTGSAAIVPDAASSSSSFAHGPDPTAPLLLVLLLRRRGRRRHVKKGGLELDRQSVCFSQARLNHTRRPFRVCLTQAPIAACWQCGGGRAAAAKEVF